MKVQMMLIRIDYINSNNMYWNKNLLNIHVWRFLYAVKRFGVLANSQEENHIILVKVLKGKTFMVFEINCKSFPYCIHNIPYYLELWQSHIKVE